MTSAKRAAEQFHADGYVGGVPILDATEVSHHRAELERVEADLGSLHYIDKVHTALISPFELATDPRVLDVVEAILGPDILLYNSTYIIKEPHAPTQVKWHQDLTYWGLADDDAQVSMWLALAPATQQSGCMQMLPGSHLDGRREHEQDSGDNNLLLLGQQIRDVDTSGAVFCELEAGQASFHHGWTIHASSPNVSDDRRIGLNVQYLAPHNRMVDAAASALLVRGTDRHHNFASDEAPSGDLGEGALAAWWERNEQMKANFKQA